MTVPSALALGSSVLANAAAATPSDELPGWSPLVFGIGSLLLLILVIVLARRKMQESQRWQQRADGRDGSGEPDGTGGSAEPDGDPRKNDDA
ncbi:hypothetical protein [Nesterenkonia lutea]|uniref:Membrane protein implicated in regulation of membrane protease activity n=1 Tax=Nesterenkonia lutea TaxID=272919 RepID=A0ABR9JFR6_9MICC|nr:hypothetical protein [Nesterenkonia lutea]MBE1524764.1 membrane protein implicated in regulation of membrane protease activity [Nesterenkonia lutea]